MARKGKALTAAQADALIAQAKLIIAAVYPSLFAHRPTGPSLPKG
jgi:hypothetical protein